MSKSEITWSIVTIIGTFDSMAELEMKNWGNIYLKKQVKVAHRIINNEKIVT